MLKAIGSSEEVSIRRFCCDVCDRTVLPSLNFESLQMDAVGAKRRHAVRTVDDDAKKNLRSALIRMCDAYLATHPEYIELGCEVVCPDCAIDVICDQARFDTEADMDIVTLQDIQAILFETLITVLPKVPPAKKRRITKS